jgi:hypothetical protein
VPRGYLQADGSLDQVRVVVSAPRYDEKALEAAKTYRAQRIPSGQAFPLDYVLNLSFCPDEPQPPS